MVLDMTGMLTGAAVIGVACIGAETGGGGGAEAGDADERSEADGSERGEVAGGDEASGHLAGSK